MTPHHAATQMLLRFAFLWALLNRLGLLRFGHLSHLLYDGLRDVVNRGRVGLSDRDNTLSTRPGCERGIEAKPAPYL